MLKYKLDSMKISRKDHLRQLCFCRIENVLQKYKVILKSSNSLQKICHISFFRLQFIKLCILNLHLDKVRSSYSIFRLKLSVQKETTLFIQEIYSIWLKKYKQLQLQIQSKQRHSQISTSKVITCEVSKRWNNSTRTTSTIEKKSGRLVSSFSQMHTNNHKPRYPTDWPISLVCRYHTGTLYCISVLMVRLLYL